MAKGKTGGRRARGGAAGGTSANTALLAGDLDEDQKSQTTPLTVVHPGGKTGRVKAGRAFRELSRSGLRITDSARVATRAAFRESVVGRSSG